MANETVFFKKVVFLKMISCKSRTPSWELRGKKFDKTQHFFRWISEGIQQISFFSIKNHSTENVLWTSSMQLDNEIKNFVTKRQKLCGECQKLMKGSYCFFQNISSQRSNMQVDLSFYNSSEQFPPESQKLSNQCPNW